jgi:hypothetical protein
LVTRFFTTEPATGGCTLRDVDIPSGFRLSFPLKLHVSVGPNPLIFYFETEEEYRDWRMLQD